MNLYRKIPHLSDTRGAGELAKIRSKMLMYGNSSNSILQKNIQDEIEVI